MGELKFNIQACFFACGAFVTFLFGNPDSAFVALLIFILMDYATGWLGAWYNCKLNSMKGWKGIVKKVVTLSLVIVANQVDTVLHMNGATRSLVIYFLLANEGLSIMENLSVMGIPIPNPLRRRLEQLTNNDEEKQPDSKS